jgi:hypothetical protein
MWPRRFHFRYGCSHDFLSMANPPLSAEPAVKHMGIVDHAEGCVLMHKAKGKQGDARERLLSMAADRFDAAARANPSDAFSLRELATIQVSVCACALFPVSASVSA